MKKKGRSRKSALPMAASPAPTPSPKSSILNSKRKAIATASPPKRRLSSISDLKDLASAHFQDIKCHLIVRSHSHILKDLEASHSRLHKLFKIHAQTCQQMMNEAEKDFKKMSERINKSGEAMKESYIEFMVDAQSTTSRVCKTTIPEISLSFEKAIGLLQSRFGMTST